MATCEKRWFRGGISALAVLALALLFSTPVRGDLLPADTVNAMPGWFDTEVVQFIEDSSLKIIDATIDYAVYAPGQFNLSFPGQDPSNGTRYVYRYRLNNLSTSEDYIRKLTVGLVGATQAANCKYIEPGPIYTGGSVAPLGQVALIGSPNPTSAVWTYAAPGNVLSAGNSSKMLIFTSPYAPTLRRATILSAATGTHYEDGDGQHNSWMGDVPSPVVPEPTTLFSLLMSGGLFVIYRVLRRK
jgi:hypothetical protein